MWIKEALIRRLPSRDPDYLRSHEVECLDCGDAGWLFIENVALRCACCLGKRPVTMAIQSSFPVPSVMAKLMTFETFDCAGAPSSSSDQQRSLRKARETLEQWARDPVGWVVITGNTGSGKTHLSVAVARKFVDVGRVVVFANVADLMDRLRRQSFTDRDDTTMQELQAADLLILDDMGMERITPFADEKLYLIINYRYEWASPTVITTNLQPEQIFDRRPHIASRLLDFRRTMHIQISGQDYRANLRSG